MELSHTLGHRGTLSSTGAPAWSQSIGTRTHNVDEHLNYDVDDDDDDDEVSWPEKGVMMLISMFMMLTTDNVYEMIHMILAII